MPASACKDTMTAGIPATWQAPRKPAAIRCPSRQMPALWVDQSGARWACHSNYKNRNPATPERGYRNGSGHAATVKQVHCSTNMMPALPVAWLTKTLQGTHCNALGGLSESPWDSCASWASCSQHHVSYCMRCGSQLGASSETSCTVVLFWWIRINICST
jgi:hypothetical protein